MTLTAFAFMITRQLRHNTLGHNFSQIWVWLRQSISTMIWPLIQPASSFSSPIFRSHPTATVAWSSFTPTVFDLQLWNVYYFFSHSSPVTTITCSHDSSQKSSILVFAPTGPTENLDTDNPGLNTIHLFNKNRSLGNHHQKNNPHSELFIEIEVILIDGAGFRRITFSDTPVLKPKAQTSLLFSLP